MYEKVLVFAIGYYLGNFGAASSSYAQSRNSDRIRSQTLNFHSSQWLDSILNKEQTDVPGTSHTVAFIDSALAPSWLTITVARRSQRQRAKTS